MMNDAPRLKLVELVSRYGRGLAGEPRRCEALLRDHCGEYRREISALTSAAEEHAAADLLTPQAGTPRAALLRSRRRLCYHVSSRKAATCVQLVGAGPRRITDDELKTLSANVARAKRRRDGTPVRTPRAGRHSHSALRPRTLRSRHGGLPRAIVVAAGGSGDY